MTATAPRGAQWTVYVAEDDVGDVVHAADFAPPADGPDRRWETSRRAAAVALAVASLAVAGGAAYLAFRRARRRGR